MIIAQAAYTYDDNALVNENSSYNLGFRELFSLSSDNELINLFSLPSSLGCCVGFLYCASRQVRSMASSGLLPPILAWGQGHKVTDSSQPVAQATAVVPGGNTEEAAKNMGITNSKDFAHSSKPTMAVFACTLLCFSLLVAGYYLVTDYNDKYTQMGQLLNALMYQFLMVSFIVFATRFSSMDRGIKSPFGIPGAVFAMAFFMLLFLIRLYYNPDTRLAFCLSLLLFTVKVVVYYFLVVQKRQFFSKEEQDKFMKAYVVNANQTRKKGKSSSQSRRSGRSSNKVIAAITGALGLASQNVSGLSSRSGASSRSGVVRGGLSVRSRASSRSTRIANSSTIAPHE
eukprot:scaffold10498_cov179-Ochromonas_danica.AAC.8